MTLLTEFNYFHNRSSHFISSRWMANNHVVVA